MSTPLVLKSLEIKRFRAFKHLQIERMSRVNLIVGKNNVGKTSLLEAVWLLAEQGSPRAIWQMLEARNETGLIASQNGSRSEGQLWVFSQLFYGRQDLRQDHRWGYYELESDKRRGISIGDQAFTIQIDMDIDKQKDNVERRFIHVLYHKDGADDFTENGWDFATDMNEAVWDHAFPSNFIPAHGLTDGNIAILWDSITLQNRNDQVFQALRLINPKIDRVDLIGNQQTRQRTLAVAKVIDLETRVPLRSLGEGMNRLFGLGLALADTKDGVLLIDEIDTGLHYSILTKMWKLVFETAQRLNVQVFATTHSWDCIQAFQAAAEDGFEKDAMLVSLRANPQDTGEVAAVLFDNERLKHVVQDSIEVR